MATAVQNPLRLSFVMFIKQDSSLCLHVRGCFEMWEMVTPLCCLSSCIALRSETLLEAIVGVLVVGIALSYWRIVDILLVLSASLVQFDFLQSVEAQETEITPLACVRASAGTVALFWRSTIGSKSTKVAFSKLSASTLRLL